MTDTDHIPGLVRNYIGTKRVAARPMTRGEYNAYRGWTPPEGEDQSAPGYLVEYQDGGKPNDPRHAGYITWTPAAPFEKAYRPLVRLTFGEALEAAKVGQRVRRAGWNGKGMWIAASCNGTREVPTESFWSPANRAYAEANGGTATVLPSMTMKTATGEILMGWLASQTDMFADDWEIVPGTE